MLIEGEAAVPLDAGHLRRVNGVESWCLDIELELGGSTVPVTFNRRLALELQARLFTWLGPVR